MSKSNSVTVLNPRAQAEGNRYLGPAEVVAVGAGSVELTTPMGAVMATLALAVPYEPCIGDQVLLIAEGQSRYVIGLLAGAGKHVLAFDGDVEVRSNTGRLRLSGKQGVEIDAPELDMQVGRLQIVAQSMIERVGTLTQRVRDLFSVQTGKKHEVVQQSTITQAKSSTLVCEETAKINGKSILLG